MRPRLIHPRRVLLYRRLDTETDAELGPTGNVEFAPPVTLFGQVKYTRFESLTPTGAGDDPASDGHIVFRAADWQEGGGRTGDEMELAGVPIGTPYEADSRLIVTEVRPAAHYRGVNHHVHVMFTRKRAAR